MKIVSLTELKNNFSSLIDLVKKGKETLLVCERDIPVIKVIWAASADSDREDAGLLQRLERAGHLVRGTSDSKKLRIQDLTVRPKHKVDLLQALLAERDEGR
jgi:antitoxin (DNA-binding transcriptional repressor) of toxin-antitoxin stability system